MIPNLPRLQNPCLKHFLGQAFNKHIGGWHAADVLLAWDGYQVIFFFNWVLHHVEKHVFLGGKTSGVT